LETIERFLDQPDAFAVLAGDEAVTPALKALGASAAKVAAEEAEKEAANLKRQQALEKES